MLGLKLIKKITATFVSILLLVSVMMTTITFAEVLNITLKSFNATTSVITLDFGNMPADTMLSVKKNQITLQKSTNVGVENITDFTISVQEMPHLDTKGTIVSQVNTVTITPNAGIIPNVMYNVLLSDTISASSGSVDATLQPATSTGWFMVKRVFSDDFNATFDEVGNPTNPYYLNTLKGDVIASKYWNADSYRQDFCGIINNKFAMKNECNIVLNPVGLPKVDYSADNYTTEYEYGFSAGEEQNIFCLTPETLLDANYKFLHNGINFRMYDFKGDKTAKISFDINWKFSNDLKIIDAYHFKSNIVKVRASTLNGNVQYFIDNDKIFDIDNVKANTGTVAYRTLNLWTQNVTSTIDNLIITKLVKIGAEIPIITLSKHNADTKAIYLDFNGIMDGSKIDISTVSLDVYKKTTKITPDKYTVNYSDNSLSISMNEGMDIGVPYEVVVKGGVRDTLGISIPMVSDTKTGAFKIEKLFSDDFSYDKGYYQSTPSGYVIENGAFFTTGQTGRFSAKSNIYEYSKWVADYTTEFDFKLPKTGSKFEMYVRANSNWLYYNEASKYMLCFSEKSLEIQAPTTSPLISVDYEALTHDIYHNARIVANGTNLKVYIDNKLILNWNNSLLTDKGTFGFNTSTTVSLDNLVLTKCTDITMTKMQIEGITADLSGIKINCSDNVDIATVAGKITLKKKNLSEEFTYTINEDIITIIPKNAMEIGKKYTVSLGGGIEGNSSIGSDEFIKTIMLNSIWSEDFEDTQVGINNWKQFDCLSYDSLNKRMNVCLSGFQDYIYPKNVFSSLSSEYTTEFDMVIDNIDNFDGLQFYSNATHNTAYNEAKKYIITLGKNKATVEQFGDVLKTLGVSDISGIAKGNNHISFTIVNNKALLFVNGRKILETDGALLSNCGMFGMRVSAKNKENIGFDNFNFTSATQFNSAGIADIDEIKIDSFENVSPVATVTVTNYTSNDSISILVALYDEKGKLIDVKSQNIILAKDNSTNVVLTLANNAKTATTIKAFIWSGANEMEPFNTFMQKKK